MLTGEADRGEPLGGAYRPIRRLSAAEAPVVGELAVACDETVVLADVDALAGWDGWLHAGSQHVYGVRDVVRRRGGHDAVLPRCVRVLDEAIGGAELSGGEVVTLAVSLLRGAGEAREAARLRGSPPPVGAWWLLADGRPVFVPSLPGAPRGEDPGASAAGIVAAVADALDDRVVRRLLDEVGGVLLDGPPTGASFEALEDRLFDACAPRPLDRLLRDEAGAAERAAAPDAVTRRTCRELRAGRSGRPPRELGAGGWTAGAETRAAVRASERASRLDLREMVDAALAGRVADGLSSAITGVRDRVRALRSRRGAPLILGGVAAGAVLVIGLMWPTDEPASAEPGADGATASPTAVPEGSTAPEGSAAPGGAGSSGSVADQEQPAEAPAEDAPVEGADDPVAAGERLLDGLAVCAAAGDAECAAVWVPNADARELDPAAAVLLPAAERAVTPLDDFGDIAVVQVAAIDGDAGVVPQSVVLERVADEDDRWGIRAVHDLAPVSSTSPGDDEGAG